MIARFSSSSLSCLTLVRRSMRRSLTLLSLLEICLLLNGCLYDNPPSGPAASIDTWLVGQWETKDSSGHLFKAIIAPASSDHYQVTLIQVAKQPSNFDAWISRVDGFSILTLKSLNDGPSLGKYSLFHYELLAPGTSPPGGVGPTRIRLSELQLDGSCRTLDSFRLRAEIRRALKDGTLLPPRDAVADLKEEKKLRENYAADTAYLNGFTTSGKLRTNATAANLSSESREKIPGSIIWIKTGGVTLKGETF